MTNTTTREALVALVDLHHAEMIAQATAHDLQGDALIDLGHLADSGTPASEAFAEGLGGDYICALEDGTIAAWGADVSLGYSLTGRELVFISPEAQLAD